MKRLAATAAVLLTLATPTFTAPAFAGDAIQDWSAARPPAAPALKSVKLDPKTTALLVLDFVKQTCNEERRPRCLPTLVPAHALLEKARAAGAEVIYSITAISTKADTLPPVAPRPDEHFVQSTPDKFLNTDLDATLKAHGIKTVVVMGTAIHGAILNTAAQAAMRGYQVVLPEDTVSGDDAYTEQAVITIMLTGPTLSARTTLSRSDLITF